jgi:hypothetical protein
MTIYATIEERTNKSLQELKDLLTYCEQKHPVIIKLLNLPSQPFYALTDGRHNDNLDSTLEVIHSLRHAFEDDGDWSIVRTVNQHILDMWKRLEERTGKSIIDSKPTPYTYTVKAGDWTMNEDKEAILIHEEDWDKIIDTYMLHINYYEEHEDEIEKRPAAGSAIEGLRGTPERQEYWRLVKESDRLYTKWFEERFSE